MNEILCEMLESEGYKVESATNADEAADKLSKGKKYYLVVLDYNLQNYKGINGIDIYDLAKKSNPNAKAIMISAYGSRKIKENAIEKGINLFLDKPFIITDLLDAIHSVTMFNGNETKSNNKLNFTTI